MRKYIRTQDGEKPVWMSKRKLIESGRREGRDAYASNREPIRFGNLTHDLAAREEYERLKTQK